MAEHSDTRTLRFEAQRPRLRAIALRLLGSTADADDAVQETWLRLQRTADGSIDNLDAWLTTVVSRVSLDMLRTPRRRRERAWFVEPWHDEPVAPAPDPAELVAQSDQVSVALLVVLDTLSPAERIAFVLRDVFGRPFDEIAAVLDRSPDAARQLASRGRRRLRGAGRPGHAGRGDGGRDRGRRIVEAWLSAVNDGDLNKLLALLDDTAVLRADYGETTETVTGSRAIADQAVLSRRLAANATIVLIDGEPGVAAVIQNRLVSVMAFDIDGSRIARLAVLADPRRLAELPIGRLLTAAEESGPTV